MLSCFTRNDSSDDTMTHSYENETLDEPTSTTKKPSKSMSMPKSPLVSLNQYFTNLGPRSLFRELARNLSKSEDITAYIGGWSLLIVIGNAMKTEIDRNVQSSRFIIEESGQY